MALVQLVYFSHPARPMSSRDVMAILEVARARNAESGITGLLCCSDESFLQVLEGERKAVCDTFYRIVRDDRHRAVTLLSYTYPTSRMFEDWTMGYAGFGEVRRDILLKHAPDGRMSALFGDAAQVMAFVRDVAACLAEDDQDAA